MYNYELYPRLKFLTLVGFDEEGQPEFFGTEEQWEKANKLEMVMWG